MFWMVHALGADLPPRLPLARTPTPTFDGMTVEQRSAAVLDWFRAKYGERLKPETPLLDLMVRHLAETVVPDTKGQLRIHPDWPALRWSRWISPAPGSRTCRRSEVCR